ncbi:MAG: HAD family hydrolase [Clostridia bacterium]|nr:HAD family hydrolase [Clostridia bacterium]
MKYDIILIDVDGTLTDPGDGVTASVAYALQKLERPAMSRKQLERFIGPPITYSFMTFAQLDPETAQLAIKYQREYYSAKGIYENRMYDGIPELLAKLKQNGAVISAATSKPEPFARRVIEHFGIAKYFDFIAGSNLDGSRIKKPEVIKYALDSLGVTDKSRVVMIGDREHDAFGAAQNGIFSIGVTYGYGTREELETAGAGHIVDTVAELGEYLMKN